MPAGELHLARSDHTATLLSDGRVLIAGGHPWGSFFPVDTSEVYDPADRNFHESAMMVFARFDASAIRLSDGRVLISGGFNPANMKGDNLALDSAEIFDPTTNSFSSTSAMLQPRYRHSSVLLPDGKVLIAGGFCQEFVTFPLLRPALSKGCDPELFDPDGGTFSLLGGQGGHTEERAVALADGKVLLICGGKIAETYDPGSGQFAGAGEMPEPLRVCSAAALNDGRVLIFGTIKETITSAPTSHLYIYDPNRKQFSLVKKQFEFWEPQVMSLDDGKVLTFGVIRPDYDDVLSTETFDSASNVFSSLEGLPRERTGFTATQLHDGSVLVAGGDSNSLPYDVRSAVRYCP